MKTQTIKNEGLSVNHNLVALKVKPQLVQGIRMNHNVGGLKVKLLGVFALALVLLFGLGTPAPTHASQSSLAVETLRNADGTLHLTGAYNGTVNLNGWDVTLDSKRGPILTPSQTAAPTADKWRSLGHGGLNNAVGAMVVKGTTLYVGGFFTKTYDAKKELNYIAKYDTVTGKWSPFKHNGLDGYVDTLLLDGDTLYMGGGFTKTADGVFTNLNHIAAFDLATLNWHALAHDGLDVGVSALALRNGMLYIGGGFSRTHDGVVTGLNNIAKYDTKTKAWSALGNNGLNNTVFALAFVGSKLYVAGGFSTVFGGASSDLNRVAQYNTHTQVWSPLANGGLNGLVVALVTVNNDLYVGGNFFTTYDTTVPNLNYVAVYHTHSNAWEALAHNGLEQDVHALAIKGTTLYVGGDFSMTQDGVVPDLHGIAKYDVTSGIWSKLPQAGVYGNVLAIAYNPTSLFVGGYFSRPYNGTVANMNRIARLP